MSSEISVEKESLADALSNLGKNERVRSLIFDLLREAETQSTNPLLFREQVRWPLVLSLLREVKAHRVVLKNGIVFEVSPDSRIEKALLLSADEQPDHVWEPQTTKLLLGLAPLISNAIVGGAYIGDHVVPLARSIADMNQPGVVHAFEPMSHAFERLEHHLLINQISNVVANRLALWSESDVDLVLQGHLALASSVPRHDNEQISGEVAGSVSIDSYVAQHGLVSVELIMLDTEGGEENALRGARETIARFSPNLIFEIHRDFVDWTEGLENTSVVTFLTSLGYNVYAIRDFHSNYSTANYPIEIIPVAHVYVEGPPHGFNVLATRDSTLVNRLQLRVVENVSPKLLLEKDPALHFPMFTNTNTRS